MGTVVRRWMGTFVEYLIPTLVVLVLFRNTANRWAVRELGIDILIAGGLASSVSLVVDAVAAGARRLSNRR
jgi:uncharacterized membrane protein YecN with MAPEG domain